VRRPSRIVSAIFPRSSCISAMSAVSMAASVPAAPIAMPMLAVAIAGASFTPSPTMPTTPYFSRSALTAATLSSGNKVAARLVDADLRAMKSAVRWLSPLSITTDARRVQGTDRVLGVWAQGVADGDDAEHLAFAAIVRPMPDDHDRLTFGFDGGEPALDVFRTHAEFVRETVVADKIG
jgi:hypothetical protein